MRAPLLKLTARQRWALYFALTGLPGLVVFHWLGWTGALIYEVVTWIPQQRFFDMLRLADTLPFADLIAAANSRD